MTVVLYCCNALFRLSTYVCIVVLFGNYNLVPFC